MKYELLQMRQQGGGVIVNTSSLGGIVGIAGRAAYHASKHGVLGMTNPCRRRSVFFRSRAACLIGSHPSALVNRVAAAATPPSGRTIRRAVI